MTQSKYKDIYHRGNVHSRQDLMTCAGTRSLCVPRERNVKDLNLVNMGPVDVSSCLFHKINRCDKINKTFLQEIKYFVQ